MILRPQPTRRDVSNDDESLLAALIGRPLTNVVYAMPAGTEWRADPAATHVHEVDMAVALEFGQAQLRLDWAQSGSDEGLALQFDVEIPATWSVADVHGVGGWSSLSKLPLDGVEIAWHRAEEHAAEVALGVVLRFNGGGSVAFALGELVGGGPSYLPDEILVLFDVDEAVRYLDSLGASWSRIRSTG